jgi:lactate dehydrogenase-like 2-hydroxyacid dehydrogenase
MTLRTALFMSVDMRDRGLDEFDLIDITSFARDGLMLATMCGLCGADTFVRSGRWHLSGGYPLGRDLSGSRVGILGLGRIGLAIAQRLVGFDCAIAYHNRRRVPGTPFRYAAAPV